MRKKVFSKKNIRGRFDMNDAVSAKETDWTESCLLVAKSDGFFSIFRSLPAFQRVIEGSPLVAGMWNLKRLLKNQKFINALPLIQTSDLQGLPLKSINFVPRIKNKLSRTYHLSTTTIRYANNCLNCLSLFGDKLLDGSVQIYETGAGYGGECKIFNDLAKSQYHRDLGDLWHVYDLPSSREIIKRFLKNFSYSVSFKRLGQKIKNEGQDIFVISNGAFSEMRGELLNNYFDSVISKAKYGYFITNFETHSAPHGGWTTEEFINRLHACGKADATILPTTEYLSYFDKQADSKLIVFGYRHIRKNATKIQNIITIQIYSLIQNYLNVLMKKFIYF